MRVNPHPWFIATFNPGQSCSSAVPDDLIDSLWLYTAYGLEPGGFLTSVLSNDFCMAVARAHRALPIDTLRHLALWLHNYAPKDSWGSSAKVDEWLAKTDDERLELMVLRKLRPSVADILRGEPA